MFQPPSQMEKPIKVEQKMPGCDVNKARSDERPQCAIAHAIRRMIPPLLQDLPIGGIFFGQETNEHDYADRAREQGKTWDALFWWRTVGTFRDRKIRQSNTLHTVRLAAGNVFHDGVNADFDGRLAAEKVEEDGDALLARHDLGDDGFEAVKGAAGESDLVAVGKLF